MAASREGAVLDSFVNPLIVAASRVGAVPDSFVNPLIVAASRVGAVPEFSVSLPSTASRPRPPIQPPVTDKEEFASEPVWSSVGSGARR